MKTKERPIIFSGPEVRAILDGRQTQTRRAVKVPPGVHIYRADNGKVCAIPEEMRGDDDPNCPDMMPRCPFGEVGGTMWAKETFATIFGAWSIEDGGKEWDPDLIVYRADYRYGIRQHFDDHIGKWSRNPLDDAEDEVCLMGGWTPSTNMVRRLSRITLKIKSVRVERVTDISEADALAEGESFGCDSRDWFRDRWDSTSGKRKGCAWADRPYVWVVEFERAAR